MTDSAEQETPIHKPSRITRRTFIAGTAIAAFSLLTGIRYNDRSQRPLPPEAESPSLKETIETQFNILLRTQKDEYEVSGKPLPQEDQHNRYTKEWDERRLRLMQTLLPLLPQHLYGPNEQGEKLKITLVAGGESNVPNSCNDSECHYLYAINLGTYFLNPDEPKKAFFNLIHELTHVQTPTDTTLEHIQIEEDTIIKKYDSSPWFEQINSILGEDFADILPELRKKVNTKRQELHQKGIKDQDMEASLERFDYGLSKTIPSEFIAVLSEFYVEGHDKFLKMYKEFFQETMVEKLYDFVKENVFQGKEYPILPNF